MGRLGFAAKGIVYAIVGVLAALVAVGAGGALTDSQGALQLVIQLPFGQLLLGLVALGLIAYAIWRGVQAFKDTERKGNDAKGLLTRTGYLISGLIYAGLAFTSAACSATNYPSATLHEQTEQSSPPPWFRSANCFAKG